MDNFSEQLRAGLSGDPPLSGQALHAGLRGEVSSETGARATDAHTDTVAQTGVHASAASAHTAQQQKDEQTKTTANIKPTGHAQLADHTGDQAGAEGEALQAAQQQQLQEQQQQAQLAAVAEEEKGAKEKKPPDEKKWPQSFLLIPMGKVIAWLKKVAQTKATTMSTEEDVQLVKKARTNSARTITTSHNRIKHMLKNQRFTSQDLSLLRVEAYKSFNALLHIRLYTNRVQKNELDSFDLDGYIAKVNDIAFSLESKYYQGLFNTEEIQLEENAHTPEEESDSTINAREQRKERERLHLPLSESARGRVDGARYVPKNVDFWEVDSDEMNSFAHHEKARDRRNLELARAIREKSAPPAYKTLLSVSNLSDINVSDMGNQEKVDLLMDLLDKVQQPSGRTSGAQHSRDPYCRCSRVDHGHRPFGNTVKDFVELGLNVPLPVFQVEEQARARKDAANRSRASSPGQSPGDSRYCMCSRTDHGHRPGGNTLQWFKDRGLCPPDHLLADEDSDEDLPLSTSTEFRDNLKTARTSSPTRTMGDRRRVHDSLPKNERAFSQTFGRPVADYARDNMAGQRNRYDGEMEIPRDQQRRQGQQGRREELRFHDGHGGARPRDGYTGQHRRDGDRHNDREDKSLQLEKVKVPQFTGTSTLEYFEWKSAFNALVHDQPYSNGRKIIELFNALTPAAKAPLAGFARIGEHYTAAYQALDNRWGNEDVLRREVMSKLTNIKMNSNSDILQMHDVFAGCVRTYRSIQHDPNALVDWLLPISVQALSEGTRREWNRVESRLKRRGHAVTIDRFFNFLEEEAAMELTNLQNRSLKPAVHRSKDKKVKKKQHVHLLATDVKRGSTKPHRTGSSATKCRICNGAHANNLKECPQMKSLEAKHRFHLAKKEKYCLKCLSGQKHEYKDCKHTCKRCGRAHHEFVCFASKTKENKIIKALATVLRSIDTEDSEESENDTQSEDSSDDAEDTSSDNESASSEDSDVDSEANDSDDTKSVHACATKTARQTNRKPLPQSLLVRVSNPKDPSKFVICRAVLDTYSTITLLEHSIADKLGLVGEETSLNVHMVADTCRVMRSRAVNLRLSHVDENASSFHVNVEAQTMTTLTDVPFELPPQFDLEDAFPGHDVTGVQTTFPSNGSRCTLIIGIMDIYKILIGKFHRSKKYPGLVMQKTKLGDIITGAIDGTESKRSKDTINTIHVNRIHVDRSADSLEDSLRRLWEVDEPTHDKESIWTAEEDKAEAFFLATTNFIGDRYEVRLPLKPNAVLPNVEDSKEMARNRLFSLERKLAKNPQLQKDYNQIITDLIDKNFVSDVTNIPCDPERSYFVPHFEVSKPLRQTTKTRQVFDYRAQVTVPDGSTSLNEQLLNGPKLQEDLTGILLRSRMYPYAVGADIKSMFHQVSVHEEDRDLLRFLWRGKNGDIRELRFNRVSFGLNCAPYLALRAVRLHLENNAEQHPNLVTDIMHSTYVDDIFKGVTTKEEGKKFAAAATEVMQKGGFPLVKWIATDQEILEDMPSAICQDKDSPLKTVLLEYNIDASTQVLGLIWDTNADAYIFDFKLQTDNWPVLEHDTKRSVVSKASRIFDPLGLISPITTKCKTLIQDCWLAKVDWDDSLPQELQARWDEVTNLLHSYDTVKIPRFVGTTKEHAIASNMLLVFADASIRNFAAAVYLRCVDAAGNISCNLVFSKAKLAPTKTVTLPRLELMAATKAVEIAEYTRQQLRLPDDTQTKFFTDSLIVYHWIQSQPHMHKTFVANRIAKIQSLSSPHDWSHINTEENVADMPSRHTTPWNDTNRDLFHHGPPWATADLSAWPTNTPAKADISQVPLAEVKKTVHLHCMSTRAEGLYPFSASRYETWTKVISVTARMLQFLRVLGNRVRQRKGEPLHIVNLAELRIEAEILWIRQTQAEFLEQEIADVENGELPNKLKKLRPSLDENQLLRADGRLQKLELDQERKRPVILPKSDITDKIIIHHHRKLMCGSANDTIALLRARYWVIGGKRTVRDAINKTCLACRRERLRPTVPRMGDLPKERFQISQPAFTNTGMDFAGPFSVVEDSKPGKQYILVFCCLTYRAVHLEPTPNLTAVSTLNAIQRFIARKGRPRRVISDNGTQLKKSAAFMKELNFDTFESQLAKQGIRWEFDWKLNPERAPHFGGAFEAMVKKLKRPLSQVLNEKQLNSDEFHTVVTAIEGIMNSRPLQRVQEDPDDIILTPGHFVLLRPPVELPILEKGTSHSDHVELAKTWRKRQELERRFRQKFVDLYLGTLLPVSKWEKTKNDNMLKEGDVVLIRDPNMPNKSRAWPLAKVTKTFPGTDGTTRVAEVLIHGKLTKRPVVSLLKLESPNKDSSFQEPGPTTASGPEEATETNPELQSKCEQHEDETTETPAQTSPTRSLSTSKGKQSRPTCGLLASKKKKNKSTCASPTSSTKALQVVTRSGRRIRPRRRD